MLRLCRTLTVGSALLLAVGACRDSVAPYPEDTSRVLAVDTTDGWVSVDLLVDESALAEVRRCVHSRPDAEAAACYGFASHEAYSAARPSKAGNFQNLCWEARWIRNKFGAESGDTRSSSQRASPCPDG